MTAVLAVKKLQACIEKTLFQITTGQISAWKRAYEL